MTLLHTAVDAKDTIMLYVQWQLIGAIAAVSPRASSHTAVIPDRHGGAADVLSLQRNQLHCQLVLT